MGVVGDLVLPSSPRVKRWLMLPTHYSLKIMLGACSALRCPLLWTVIAFLLCALPAKAEPTATDRATARALAQEGYRALKRNDFKLAEDRFRRADRLVHAPTLVVDHARALAGLGRLVEAHERCQLVLREGIAPGAPESWKRALKAAEQESAELEPRLAWLTISVVGPEQPKVSVDGRERPAATIGVRTATDPGTRAIEVTAPGFVPEAELVTLSEGEERSISFELEPSPAAPSKPEPAVPPTKPAGAEPPADDSTRTILTYVAFGVGGAGLAVGAAAGMVALSERSTLKDECPTSEACPPGSSERIDRYHKFGTISGIGFAVGLAGAGAGLALLLTGQSDNAAVDTKQATVQPYVAPGAIGVQGRF
jgi:hypothetical protein